MRLTCMGCGTDSEGDTCPICHKYDTEDYVMDDSKPPRVVALEKELAEARDEIEKLKAEIRDNNHLAARQIVPAEMAVDDLRTEIERKDKLIEQMREALRLLADEYSLHVSRYENRNAHDDQCYIAAEQALAAERGE